MAGPQTVPTDATGGGGNTPAVTAQPGRNITPGVPVKVPTGPGAVYIPPPPPANKDGSYQPYAGGSYQPPKTGRFRRSDPPRVWSGYDPRLAQAQQQQQNPLSQLIPLLLLQSVLKQGDSRDDDEPKVVYVQVPTQPVYNGQGGYVPTK